MLNGEVYDQSYERIHNNLEKLKNHLQDKNVEINYERHPNYEKVIKPGVIVEILIKMPNNERYSLKGEQLKNDAKKAFYVSLTKNHKEFKSHQTDVYNLYDSSVNYYCLYWELERKYNNRESELVSVLELINKNTTYSKFVADVSKMKLDDNMRQKRFKEIMDGFLGKKV